MAREGGLPLQRHHPECAVRMKMEQREQRSERKPTAVQLSDAEARQVAKAERG